MGVPLCVICHFSLVAFNILSLSLIFLFDYHVSWYVHPWFFPDWDSLRFLDLVDYFFSRVQEAFSYYLFKYLLSSFLSLFSPSGTPIMWMLVRLMLSQRSLKLSSFFSFFFLYSVLWQWFPPFCPPGHLSDLLLSNSAIDSL